MKQGEREYFIGERILNFTGKDTLRRVTKFINRTNCEWKDAELYCLLIEHHCASTGRANAAARTWRRTSIVSWAITIITILLSLALSEMVDLALVLVLGFIAFLALISALALIYIRMQQMELSQRLDP